MEGWESVPKSEDNPEKPTVPKMGTMGQRRGKDLVKGLLDTRKNRDCHKRNLGFFSNGVCACLPKA